MLGKFNDSKSKMKLVAGLAGVMLGFLVLALPFMVTIGKLTTKPTGQKILEKIAVLHVEADSRLALLNVPELVMNVFDQSPLFSSWWEGEDKGPAARFMWSFMVLGDSYLKGLNYLGCAFALVGLLIGFYDGFFGPGTGSFLMVAFVVFFGFDFLAATAGAKMVNIACNLASLAWFAPAGVCC